MQEVVSPLYSQRSHLSTRSVSPHLQDEPRGEAATHELNQVQAAVKGSDSHTLGSRRTAELSSPRQSTNNPVIQVFLVPLGNNFRSLRR